MRFLVTALVLAELAVYGSVSGAPGGGEGHPVAYEFPTMLMEPDDDENENRVRPRRLANSSVVR